MTTHSSILACEFPWTVNPGVLQSMGSQRVRHDLVTNTFTKDNPFFVDLWIMRGTKDAETQKSQSLHVALQPTLCFQFCIWNSTNCSFCSNRVHIYWKKNLRIVNLCSSNMFKDHIYIKIILEHFKKIKIYINLLFITKIIHVNFS